MKNQEKTSYPNKNNLLDKQLNKQKRRREI